MANTTCLFKSLKSLHLNSTRYFWFTPICYKRAYIYRKKIIDKGKDFPSDLTTRKELIRDNFKDKVLPNDLDKLRNMFPEFLPSPILEFRHKTFSYVERRDMLMRRKVIDVPEFYVGSIMAVVVSDPFAIGKVSRFVGICIMREGHGLRANFTLRNFVDKEGIEIRYDIYNPTIRSIEVLKLEKRPDPHLLYLRDAEPQYSTFPFDMEPEIRKEDDPIPVNYIKVRMKPMPWSKFWNKQFPSLVGFEKMEVPDIFVEKTLKHYEQFKYDRFDLMKEYREHYPEDEQIEIWKEVDQYYKESQDKHKKAKEERILKTST